MRVASGRRAAGAAASWWLGRGTLVGQGEQHEHGHAVRDQLGDAAAGCRVAALEQVADEDQDGVGGRVTSRWQ